MDMAAIFVESTESDEARREKLFGGALFFYGPRESSKALCEFAWELIQEAFSPFDPRDAQHHLPVEDFVKVISPLKTTFTHHPRAKQLLRGVLEELGCEPAQTYFDVPKLRVVSSDGYLTAGVGYAYKHHRDTWYACPPAQINWWMPITEITAQCALALHPNFFDRAVPNDSGRFDAYQWNADGRKNAAMYIGEDPRPHPKLTEPRDLDWQMVVGKPGSLLLFSAQHLHATVPNTSGRTRFSIDFRTVNRDDIERRRGAKLVDSLATGTTLRDFLRATDHQRFPEDIVAAYDTGSETGSERGVLIFDPAAVTPKAEDATLGSRS